MGSLTLPAAASFLGLLAFAVTVLVTPLVRRVATILGAVAHGGGRHSHAQPVPRWGGIALGCGFVAALCLADRAGVELGYELARFAWPVRPLVMGALIILGAGVVDDLVALGARAKLALQVVAGVIAVWGGFGFSVFSNPLFGGQIDVGVLGPLASLLWIVGVTNAFNLIDGLDGLATGVGLIAVVTLISVSVAGDRPDAVLVFAALGGALAGFLCFNFSPASIFLGDSGSLLLGYLFAVLSVQSLQKGPTTVVLMVPLLALGLPIIETSVTVARRLLVSGFAAVFLADADHIHHRLLARGFTHRRAVMALYAACTLLGLLALLAVAARGSLDVWIVLLVVAATLLAMRRLGYPHARLAEAPLADDITDRPHLGILVLGDLGRSPRTSYHAWAAAESGFDVDLIGQASTSLLGHIRSHPRITVHSLAAPARVPWESAPRWVALLRSVHRVVVQSLELVRGLHALPRLESLLVQSPPAIPTIFIAWLVARQRQSLLVVDWHNFGFSMLAKRLGDHHPIVRLAALYEWRIGRRAGRHLCVSEAMASVLRRELESPDVTVLYDRPAEHFRPLPVEEKVEARRMLATSYDCRRLSASAVAIAVSPTSFTADEDMDMLFDGLFLYGEIARAQDISVQPGRLPELVVVLSGRGELREACEQRARSLGAHNVAVEFLWVEAEHYPALIAAADIGISLHRSTSGVDLAMKVADMLGAGVPVCAFDYGPTLREQLMEGSTGLFFGEAAGLAATLNALLEGFPESSQLSTMTEAVRALPRITFAEEWRRVVLPLLRILRNPAISG